MEPQQQQQYYHHHEDDETKPNNNNNVNSNGTVNVNGGGYVCRQSSTRWTPTTEQIRILKELYYNNGVRSPTAEQIQRISAKLRQYGKIEGKNVFYWFQNHKARERQKKRLTASAAAMQTPQATVWRDNSNSNNYNSHCSNFNPCAGVVNVGPIGNYGYAMETNFREYAWVEVDHQYSSTPYYPFLDKIKATTNYEDHQETLDDHHEYDQDDNDDDDHHHHHKEPETLPLFPITADDHHHAATGFYGGAAKLPESTNSFDQIPWCRYDENAPAARASLELTLNSSYNIATSSHYFP